MAAKAILVNQGRDAMITYFRNSVTTPQSNKLYIADFVLLTGISGDPVVEKIWDGSGTGEDLSSYMIVGDDGSPADARFAIDDRTQESGRKLRLWCVVPTNFSTDDATIDGIAILFKKQDNTYGLLGYGTREGENKVAGTDLTLFFDVQM